LWIEAVRYQQGYPCGGEDAIILDNESSKGRAFTSNNITIKNSYLVSGYNGSLFETDTITRLHNIHIENSRMVRAEEQK